MTDFEVCRLSAEAMWKEVSNDIASDDGVFVSNDPSQPEVHWNPLTNAEQRWECVEWLLELKCFVFLYGLTEHKIDSERGGPIYIDCPASEFPARAVAELQRRKIAFNDRAR